MSFWDSAGHLTSIMSYFMLESDLRKNDFLRHYDFYFHYATWYGKIMVISRFSIPNYFYFVTFGGKIKFLILIWPIFSIWDIHQDSAVQWVRTWFWATSNRWYGFIEWQCLLDQQPWGILLVFNAALVGPSFSEHPPFWIGQYLVSIP